MSLWPRVSRGSSGRSQLRRDVERKGSRQILPTLGKNQTPPHFYGGVGLGDRQQGVLVYGVYISALSSSLTASLPPALTTLPLWSTVEVWPARALLMLPVALHLPVAGL